MPDLLLEFFSEEIPARMQAKARAEQAYLNAVYSFHDSMAALESAVGRKLK